MDHDRAYHLALKLDRERLARETTFAGMQQAASGSPALELRLCSCESTLGLPWPRNIASPLTRDDELRARADYYAEILAAEVEIRGHAEILNDTDGSYLDGFRDYIPGALARRGLALDEIPGGFRVRP